MDLSIPMRTFFGILFTSLLVLKKAGCNVPRPLTNELEPDTEDSADRANLDELVDPQGSWISFVQHSDRTDKQRKPSHRSRRGKKNKSHLYGPPGPPGPIGPQGPPGSPGGHVTKQELLKQFKELVQEEAERRAGVLMAERCPECDWVVNATLPLVELDAVNVIPRVIAGFHQRLRANTVVLKRSLGELKDYHRPFGGGAFQRGEAFNPAEGRFTAPRQGIYQFVVNLHLVHEGYRSKRPRKLRRRENVKVSICIQSLCQKHTSLEYISGLESSSRAFTTTVTGLLHLEEGQYTSVYVENGSSKSLTVLEGSDFSGVLVGT